MNQPLIDAMKQALEALEEWEKPMSKGSLEAHRILRTAIAEAEKQEPVAWLTGCPECGMDSGCDCDSGTWNPPAAQPAPVQEPAAKYIGECFDGSLVQLYEDVKKGTNFYIAPPAAQRQPLTDDRIGQIIEQCKITLVNYCSGEKQTEFARAIEAAHGITGENT